MNRVVVTGFGVVSSLGNNRSEVLDSLKKVRSGIEFNQEYADFGFRSHVCGTITADIKELVPRKDLRFMGDGAAYNYISMAEAIEDAALSDDDITSEMTGLVVGSGVASGAPLVEMADTLRNRGARKVNPFYVPKIMSSCNAANLATAFKIRGYSYTISSACATSSHCLGNAYQLIQAGEQDLMFVGGGDELSWIVSIAFDSMGALSSNFNDTPQTASRAYDKDRDGFVVTGGGGTIVLEDYERAKARGAKIYCEVTGYGISSDGYDMVRPSGEGAERCMRMALKTCDGKIDYLNAHGTSTPAGDITELVAIKNVFGENGELPYIGSTKSLSGHSLGAAGVHEAIYCILMMDNNFICPSANIENLDPEAEPYPIVLETMNDYNLNHVMSNSFGFGGTNCSLIFSKV
tara:strand:- start:10196 stop:11413 length:1218 start_codon:yes stop_codon:yes gene_type:complete